MSVMALEDDVEANITHFAHRAEFLALLGMLLEKLDESDDMNLDEFVKPMGAILDQYLSLPGLLDPALNEIVGPLMQRLTACLRDLSRNQCQPHLGPALIAIGRIINWVIKVRGWKAVVPQFPSDIHFLPLLADLLSPPTSPSSSKTPATPHHPLLSTDEAWEIRSVLLLWLSLLLTVPFNLSALSSDITPISCSIDYTAQQRLFTIPAAGLTRQVILLAVPLLFRPGKEGAYAALVLARLYSREDAAPGLPGFLDWAGQEFREGEREGEANLIASIFEFLAVLPTLIRPQRLDVLEEFMDEVLLPHLRGSRTAATSGLIRKLAIKAKGRWWVARIGSKRSEDDLPDSIEDLIGDLMSGLGDKDTIVRYSAAKYLARITAILPEGYQEQIVGATLALFGGTDDDPVIESSFGTVVDPGGSGSGGTMGFGGAESLRGDARWHGVCLALAELARRGLVKEEVLGETVTWVLKALSFDLRRASHSVGANVRDAAAYLLWSLSRACSPSVFDPFATDIATALIRAACFDREVGVRRAASAAFQEGVGRLGLYPEGIDVLGKTDFFSVSVRRVAFTTAAPAVAVHRVYRDTLRQHLHDISLRHWDKSVRDLGSQALRDIVKIGGAEDLHDAVAIEITALASVDPCSIHGGLVALRELAADLDPENDELLKSKIFTALATIRASALVTASAADVLRAVCEVMIVTATTSILDTQTAKEQISHIIQTTMRRTEADCQEAVARLFGCLSAIRSPQADINRLLTELKSSRAAIRQSSALSLGCIRYDSCVAAAPSVVEALLHQLDPFAKADVETRRYALRSLANTAIQPIALATDVIHAIVQAAISALSDYSTDQRGDIGSWIRITGLAALSQMLSVPTICCQLDQHMVDSAIGGIVKQGVEKLEPCRSQAYTTLSQLRRSGLQWSRQEAMNSKTGSSNPNFREIPQLDWFNSAMPLLRTKYSDSLVAGLVISIGSSIPSVSKTSLQALLSAFKADPGLLEEVIGHLSRLLAANLNNVRVFVPTMSTITQVLSSEVVSLAGAQRGIGTHAARIVSSASRGISTVKSIERLTASLKLCIAFLPLRIPTCQEKVIDAIGSFLTHRFPRIRAVTAEQLYLKLSEDDVDPDLEEVLLETSWTDEGVADEAAKVIALLRTTLGNW